MSSGKPMVGFQSAGAVLCDAPNFLTPSMADAVATPVGSCQRLMSCCCPAGSSRDPVGHRLPPQMCGHWH